MVMDRVQELREGREEYFLDKGTDVEAEEEPDYEAGEDLEQPFGPWNPEQIRVNTKQFSLRNVLDMIEESSIELAPDFQRDEVWKPVQKSRLVESVLLQIPLPAFYFAEDREGNMRVVDGLQRLSTIRDFVRGDEKSRFKLRDLEYLRLDATASRISPLFCSDASIMRRSPSTSLIRPHPRGSCSTSSNASIQVEHRSTPRRSGTA